MTLDAEGHTRGAAFVEFEEEVSRAYEPSPRVTILTTLLIVSPRLKLRSRSTPTSSRSGVSL